MLRDSGPVSSNSTREPSGALIASADDELYGRYLIETGGDAGPPSFVVGRRALHRRADVLFVHPAVEDVSA